MADARGAGTYVGETRTKPTRYGTDIEVWNGVTWVTGQQTFASVPGQVSTAPFNPPAPAPAPARAPAPAPAPAAVPAATTPANAPSTKDISGAGATFSAYLKSLGQGPDTESLNKELMGSYNLLDQSQQRDLNQFQLALGQQQESGIGDLRANLAQRGLLDSGSLGAGVTDINKTIAQQLQQGYSASTARKESQKADMLQQALNRNLQRQQAVAKLSQDAWEMLSKLGLGYDQLAQQDKEFLGGLSFSRDQLKQQYDEFSQQLSFNQVKANKDRESAENMAFWENLTGLVGAGAKAAPELMALV